MDDLPQLCRLGRFTFDTGRGVLSGPDGETRLRPKTCDVLLHLLRHPGRVVSRGELMEAAWGRAAITDDSLTQCLVEIRRALGDNARRLVRTVPRRGYLLDVVPEPVVPGPGMREPATVAATRLASRRLPLLLVPALLAAVLAWWGFGRPGETPPADAIATKPNSIAVLPFVDMSAGRDQAHLGEGIAEEILNALAQYRDLEVIARTSSFSFRDRPVDARTIAAELGVTYLLEGSVRRSGDRVRVIAQLIDGRDSTHVWSKDFDRALDDIFAVQHEIAGSIAGALQVASSGGAAHGTPHDVRAYERLLQGRYLHQRRGPGDVERAREHLQAAIDIDPGYAAAWAALAGTWLVQLGDDRPAGHPGYAPAREAAARALELDPHNVEAHLRAAVLEYIAGEVAAAWRHVGIAEELEPGNLLLLGIKAGRALGDGNLAAAIELQQRAVARDPLSALNRLNLANFLVAAGRLEEARRQALATLELSPDDRTSVNELLLEILVLEKRYQDAAAIIAELPSSHSRDVASAIVDEALGRTADAVATIERLRARGTWQADLGIAGIHGHLGRTNEAWHWLAQSRRRVPQDAFTDRRWRTHAWRSYFLEPLRHNPRWTALFADPAPIGAGGG